MNNINDYPKKERIDLDELPLKDRIIVTTSSKLTKHFRHLEKAGILDQETTRTMIGCVMRLTSLAKGEDPQLYK